MLPILREGKKHASEMDQSKSHKNLASKPSDTVTTTSNTFVLHNDSWQYHPARSDSFLALAAADVTKANTPPV